MLQLFMFFNVLKHPIAADVVLVPTCYAEKPTVVAHHRPAELRDVILEINKILGLLVGGHIVEMNIFVAPFKVVDDSFIGKLLFDYENVLEEVDDPLLDVEMVELGDHRLLIFKVSLVLVDQSIPLIDDVPDVVEHRAVGTHVKLSQFLSQVLVLLLFPLKLIVHVFYLDVVALKFPHDELLVYAPSESILDLAKSHGDIWQLLNVSLRVFRSIQESFSLLFEHINLVVEDPNLVLEIGFVELVNIDDVVISVLADRTSETNSARAVFTKAFYILVGVIVAPEANHLRLLSNRNCYLVTHWWLLLAHGHACVRGVIHNWPCRGARRHI